MGKWIIEVHNASDDSLLGYFGGRVPVAVIGPLASYELKIAESIDEAQPFEVEFGATLNASSLSAEFPDKSFVVQEINS
jgi:hypothetical protein